MLSTAIPIVIAAMVIVIISKGILNKPINPNIILEAIIFGIIPKILSSKDLNKIINIKKIERITKPKDLICDEKSDCNILLYNTKRPFTLNSFIFL